MAQPQEPEPSVRTVLPQAKCQESQFKVPWQVELSLVTLCFSLGVPQFPSGTGFRRASVLSTSPQPTVHNLQPEPLATTSKSGTPMYPISEDFIQDSAS